MASSGAPDALDPFLAHARAPAPLAGAAAPDPIITRLEPDAAVEPRRVPAEGRIAIPIRGSATLVAPPGIVATTVLPAAPGARFRLVSDERPASRSAPSALAFAAAGVAFCFLTQFGRYIEHRKYKVHGLRLVQTWTFERSGRAEDFSLRGAVSPVETHVFLNADERDDAMQTLLEIAENTCYLHASLRSALPGRVEATLNGEALL
ncbi:MAG: OsmC family protein [Burkholderiales bacterium]|nr:OsmC family protein [Burkholderiales bacterium]